MKHARPGGKSAVPGGRCRRRIEIDGQGRQARDCGRRAERQGGREAARPQPLADRTGPGRRRVHRRGLRDRGAAGARPLVGEQDRQRVRRLCGNERGRVRGGCGGQRDHAGGDDARDRPAGANAIPRCAGQHAAAAQLRRVRDQGRADALPSDPGGAQAAARRGPDLGRRPGSRSGRGAAVRALLG